MTKLSYTKYETIIKNLIRDYLDGYLTHSNYIDKATEVYDLAWNDKNINTDEYMVLSLLVQASSVVYDECNSLIKSNYKEYPVWCSHEDTKENEVSTKKYVCKVCCNTYNEPFCILDVGVDGFNPKNCPYNMGNVKAKWELIGD